MDDRSFTIRVPRKWGRIGMTVIVTTLIVAPLAAYASHSFTDVPDTHTFHDDIAWMKASGVTRGCNPPANTRYCPDDEVTRGQMGAFMRRFSQYLGAEDGTPAIADNAAMLGGQNPDAYDTFVFGHSTEFWDEPPGDGPDEILVALRTRFSTSTETRVVMTGTITFSFASTSVRIWAQLGEPPCSDSIGARIRGAHAEASGSARNAAFTAGAILPPGDHALILCLDPGAGANVDQIGFTGVVSPSTRGQIRPRP